jgi:hypothetical protein
MAAGASFARVSLEKLAFLSSGQAAPFGKIEAPLVALANNAFLVFKD